MLVNHTARPSEHRKVQRVEQATRQHDAAVLRNPDRVPSYPASSLGGHSLSGRGNAPVRAALMLQMQQAYGNRAVQRMLNAQRTPGTPAAPAAPLPATQRQPASTAPSDDDPAIVALNLEPEAKEGAKTLKKMHPEIGFTSGRRSWTGQAHAMAH